MKLPLKKTLVLVAALLYAVAGLTAVSCRNASEENSDVPTVGGEVWPVIDPMVFPDGGYFRIEADGTTILGTSSGCGYKVMAKAVTLTIFTCYLGPHQSFELYNECNLTLWGKTIIHTDNSKFTNTPVWLSGNGSLTLRKLGKLNLYFLADQFAAAEGHTMTFSGEVDEGSNYYSYTWTVKKNL